MLYFLNAALLALSVVPWAVRGHITPTGLISEIQGGEERAFRWSFDKSKVDGDPFAREMFRVDLMWGKGHWVAMLAKNISVHDNQVHLRFLPEYGFSSSAYYIRYMTYKTNAKVYTEKFTLSHMSGEDFAERFKEYPDRDMASHGSGGLVPANSGTNSSTSHTQRPQDLTLSDFATGPTRTVTFRPAVATTVASSSSLEIDQVTSQMGGPLGPIGALPTASTEGSNLSGSRSGAMSLSRQRDGTWQQISLILWPVLVGAIMAM